MFIPVRPVSYLVLIDLKATMRTYELYSYCGEQLDRQGRGCAPVKIYLILAVSLIWNDP